MSIDTEPRRGNDPHVAHELRRTLGRYECRCGRWWGATLVAGHDHLREVREAANGAGGGER